MASTTIEHAKPLSSCARSFTKNLFWTLICATALFSTSSCGHSDNKQDTAAESAYQPPVVKQITFSNERKINWAKTTTVPFIPAIVDVNIDQLPATSYADTAGFKPFKSRVDTVKFGSFNSFPKKSFDVNKIPAKPLVYHATVLPAPKIIKAGPPRPANGAAAGLYMLNDVQGLEGLVVSATYSDHNGFLWIATEKRRVSL